MTHRLLADWSNFYIMAGSAAASLTGLMFVVITLVAGLERARQNTDGIGAFSTPTVLHFGIALLVSAIFSAPWRGFTGPAVLAGLVALLGIGYLINAMNRARKLSDYRADMSDWLWYTISPFIAYVALLAGAILLVSQPRQALFVLGAAVIFLIFIGIRNAWDIVTYIVVGAVSKAD